MEKSVRMDNQSNVSNKGKEFADRPDWDTYFLRIAKLVAQRSTCIRRQVGAVIVRENRILATGYNGAPNGVAHCFQRPEGCLREAQNIPNYVVVCTQSRTQFYKRLPLVFP